MVGEWVNPLETKVQYEKAFHSTNSLVVGTDSNSADYGTFTTGTTTGGWDEAITALNIPSNNNGTIFVLPGSYDFSSTLTVELGTNNAIDIIGLGSIVQNQYSSIVINSKLQSGTGKPVILIGYTGSSASTSEIYMSNISVYGNGNEQGGITAVTVGMHLINVRVHSVNGQAAIAQIGHPAGAIWSNVDGSIATTNTPSSDALVFGSSSTAAGIYFNGQDNMSSLYGYTVVGRPEITISHGFGSTGGQANAAGFYFSDCNWIRIIVGSFPSVTAVDMYHPFADNYNWAWVIMTHVEGVTGHVLRVDGSSVGKGGSNTPTGVYFMAGNSSNGSPPSVSVTGTSFFPVMPGQGVVGAAPTSVTPTSGTAITNNYPERRMYIVGGGTVSGIDYNGTSTGLTSGVFELNYGDSITITFSSAPTVLVQDT